MKLLITQFPPVSSFFHPLRPKYLPQYSTLKHLQLIFFPQCVKRSFKQIQNNTKNHSPVQSLQTEVTVPILSRMMTSKH
jgi:hypothetical protein